MKITVELPDDVARRPDRRRDALEALTIEGYRAGALTHHEASQLLQLSRLEFDGSLKARNIYDHAYDLQEFEQDLKTVCDLEASGRMPRP
jgi:predicted HTH domain antitoxin